MRVGKLLRFLKGPGSALLLICLCFGLGFFLGRWTLRLRSENTVVVTGREIEAASVTAAEPVNINTADAAELERLPGIGPALAARIVAYREEKGPFSYCYELTDVAGIGSSIYEGLREQITVGP